MAAPLPLGLRANVPVILQAEAVESGLASLAMVAGYHGFVTDLASLRKRFFVSPDGATLSQVIRVASCLDLAARPLRLELDELTKLKTPCILQWNANDFVVLKEARARHIRIHDPACGVRKLKYADASPHFTGVALELSPTANFRPADARQKIRPTDQTHRTVAFPRLLAQVPLLAWCREFFANDSER